MDPVWMGVGSFHFVYDRAIGLDHPRLTAGIILPFTPQVALFSSRLVGGRAAASTPGCRRHGQVPLCDVGRNHGIPYLFRITTLLLDRGAGEERQELDE